MHFTQVAVIILTEHISVRSLCKVHKIKLEEGEMPDCPYPSSPKLLTDFNKIRYLRHLNLEPCSEVICSSKIACAQPCVQCITIDNFCLNFLYDEYIMAFLAK
jgi:hypothetical protein